MKKYGNMTDADLDSWQMLPGVAPVLISKEFGAWLQRRDERRDQERINGKWIYKQVRGGNYYYCSICHNTSDIFYKYNFCPNCGARMEEGNANSN